MNKYLKNNRLAIKEKLKSASDFIRIVILNQYGDIYLDGDVELKSSIPRFLYACYGILLNIKIKKMIIINYILIQIFMM